MAHQRRSQEQKKQPKEKEEENKGAATPNYRPRWKNNIYAELSMVGKYIRRRGVDST